MTCGCHNTKVEKISVVKTREEREKERRGKEMRRERAEGEG